MQELVGRLRALDPEATETLKVIAYFDALIDGHASSEVLLRGAAILSGCAAGVTADGTTLRVDASGARAVGTRGEWPSRRIGDGGTAWIERTGAAHANDDMILERLTIALGIALERTSPTAASRRALHNLIDQDASTEVRQDAARRLQLDSHTPYRVIATTTDSTLRPPSVVIGTEFGPVRVGVAREDEHPSPAGIGLACVPDSLAQSWASALIALRLSSAREPVVRADDLGAVLGLASAAGSVPFEIPDVTALAALVRSHPGAAALLEAIAATDSLRAAGVEAGLHHSTVQARAGHFSNALGFDLRSPQGRVRLSLAFALHRLSTHRFD